MTTTQFRRQMGRSLGPDRLYPVELDFHYQMVSGRKVVDAGRGRTVSISSTTVLFKADHDISAGWSTEAMIEWPVRLDDSLPLRLHLHGETIPCEHGFSRIRISSYFPAQK